MAKARTRKDIENHPMVESLHTEFDGFSERDVASYWCYLKAGFVSPDMGCGSIHEQTIREVCDLLNNARRCTEAEIAEGYVTSATLEEAQANWERYDS